jgi:hypothetical protein
MLDSHLVRSSPDAKKHLGGHDTIQAVCTPDLTTARNDYKWAYQTARFAQNRALNRAISCNPGAWIVRSLLLVGCFRLI